LEPQLLSPIAALVGVMIMVAIGTFEWISFRIINKMPKHDIFVGVLVAIITILLHNLALAVLIGVIISALVLHGRVLNAFVLENTSMRKGKALRNIRAIILSTRLLPKNLM
jgi:MFS superfamily sulfate permease-like transporter